MKKLILITLFTCQTFNVINTHPIFNKMEKTFLKYDKEILGCFSIASILTGYKTFISCSKQLDDIVRMKNNPLSIETQEFINKIKANSEPQLLDIIQKLDNINHKNIKGKLTNVVLDKKYIELFKKAYFDSWLYPLTFSIFYNAYLYMRYNI